MVPQFSLKQYISQHRSTKHNNPEKWDAFYCEIAEKLYPYYKTLADAMHSDISPENAITYIALTSTLTTETNRLMKIMTKSGNNGPCYNTLSRLLRDVSRLMPDLEAELISILLEHYVFSRIKWGEQSIA